MKSHRSAHKATLFALAAAYVFVASLLLHASAAAGTVRGGLGLPLTFGALNSSKTLLPFHDPRHAADGRYLFDRRQRLARPFATSNGTTLFNVNESVQTFDIFAPPSTFTPGPAGTATNAATNPLTPTNLTPVWTASQSFIVFASNRPSTVASDPPNAYHIWAAPQDGSGAAIQITSGSGDDLYPALSSGDQQLAFVSSANSAGIHNLYTIPVSGYLAGGTPPAPTNVNMLGSSAIQSPSTSKTQTLMNGSPAANPAGFTDVQRPTWSPAGNALVFSALTTADTNNVGGNGHYHLYFLYTSTNGASPPGGNTGSNNPPGILTDGPTDDTDPAWAPNGGVIAFASTANAFAANPNASGTRPLIPTSLTNGPGAGADRNLYLMRDAPLGVPATVPGGPNGDTNTAQSGARITQLGQDNYGPAWSSTTANRYINPGGMYDYLAWGRGASVNSTHDIYYMRTLTNPATSTFTITPEGQPINNIAGPAGEVNTPVKLNTDDAAGSYGKQYPTWSPFHSIFSIAYASNRSITYNDPATGVPLEVAASVPQGGAFPGGGTVGPNYRGIFQSLVLDLDPPTLLPFNASEEVHVNAANAATDTPVLGNSGAVHFINPSPTGGNSYVTFTVRLSNREAGISDTGVNGLPDVYLQIKDPDSKYQDSQGLEHKVFAKDNTYFTAINPLTMTPYHPLTDSGSAENLVNGVGTVGANKAPRNLSGNRPNFFQRGAVGGEDRNGNTGTISVGHDNGGTDTYTVQNSDGTTAQVPVIPTRNDGTPSSIFSEVVGGDPNQWTPWGPEYEAQYVNPSVSNAQNGNPFNGVGDYGTPYYLAGVDDQTAFSGYDPGDQSQSAHFGEPGFTFSGFEPPRRAAPQQPNAGHPASDTNAQWLQMQRVPGAQQDNQGGVLYYVTWRVPTAVSDFYLDVIAYDKARFPAVPSDTSPFANPFVTVNSTSGAPPPATLIGARPDNWRIFDNIWGFTTSQFNGSNDILVVSDNALGQKFAGPTFQGQIGSSNLVSKQFGAESYVTDVDKNILPDSVYYGFAHQATKNGNVTTPAFIAPSIQRLHTYPAGQGSLTSSNGLPYSAILNGLGVGSYYDGIVGQDGTMVDGLPDPRSQRYDIWRILSRGPLDPAVLRNYQPGTDSQPAVADTAANVSAPAGTVAVANKCVLWISPFTGALVFTPGSLTDQSTQRELAEFLNGSTADNFAGGGRLCISGQRVGTANQGSNFLADVLSASLVSSGTGSQFLTGNDLRITGSGQSDGVGLNMPEYLDGAYTFFTFIPPSGGNHPPILGNSLYGDNPAPNPTWRADASLDEIGPGAIYYGPSFNNSLVGGQIDTIAPITGAGLTSHVDVTLNGDGLIYTENATTNSKTVYASFGLESISTEYYLWYQDNPGLSIPQFSPYNKRQNILHNIVDYLRTGTISGRVVQTAGGRTAGVPGATVYLTGGGNSHLSRTVFSALTVSDGTFTINGVEPGTYGVTTYKTGYTRASSRTTVTVEGDTSGNEGSLDIEPLPDGTITGTVKDAAGNLINGATVTFTSLDGQTTVFGTTGGAAGNGNYSINAPQGTYTGVATDPPNFGPSATSAQVPVTSGKTTPNVNFQLTVAVGNVTGFVRDTSGVGVAGATVIATPNPAGGAATTTTTGTNGSYTFNNLVTGNYNLTASKVGFFPRNGATATVTGGGTAQASQDIILAAAVNVTLQGQVTSGGTGIQATITITNPDGTAATPGTVATDATGHYSVTILQGTYNLKAAATGFVTAAPNGPAPITGNPVTVSTNPTVANFTLAVAPSLTAGLSAGHYNMVSWPYEDDTPLPGSTSVFTDIFGSLISPANPNGNRGRAMIYDSGGLFQSARASYVAEPAIPADALHLGRGYFVYIQNLKPQFTLLGTPPAGATVSVALQGGNGLDGWNMIGVPSTTPISVSNLHFQIGSVNAKYSDAVGAGYIYPTVYAYSPGSNSYVSVTQMQPFQGYWIHAKISGLTILIPTGGG